MGKITYGKSYTVGSGKPAELYIKVEDNLELFMRLEDADTFAKEFTREVAEAKKYNTQLEREARAQARPKKKGKKNARN